LTEVPVSTNVAFSTVHILAYYSTVITYASNFAPLQCRNVADFHHVSYIFPAAQVYYVSFNLNSHF